MTLTGVYATLLVAARPKPRQPPARLFFYQMWTLCYRWSQPCKAYQTSNQVLSRLCISTGVRNAMAQSALCCSACGMSLPGTGSLLQVSCQTKCQRASMCCILGNASSLQSLLCIGAWSSISTLHPRLASPACTCLLLSPHVPCIVVGAPFSWAAADMPGSVFLHIKNMCTATVTQVALSLCSQHTGQLQQSMLWVVQVAKGPCQRQLTVRTRFCPSWGKMTAGQTRGPERQCSCKKLMLC